MPWQWWTEANTVKRTWTPPGSQGNAHWCYGTIRRSSIAAVVLCKVVNRQETKLNKKFLIQSCPRCSRVLKLEPLSTQTRNHIYFSNQLGTARLGYCNSALVYVIPIEWGQDRQFIDFSTGCLLIVKMWALVSKKYVYRGHSVIYRMWSGDHPYVRVDLESH